MSEKVQDCSAYTQADANELVRQHDRWLQDKQRQALQAIRDMTTDCQVDRLLEIRLLADAALVLGKPEPVCSCRNSSFGMDVDRCPVHGEGCA